MAGIPGRKGREWELARQVALRGATVCTCQDCRYPGIPMSYDDRIPSRTHPSGWRPGPLYPTADHVLPVSLTEGWSDADRRAVLNNPEYLRPVHLGCNASRGNRPLRSRRRDRPTRDWGV